MGVTVSRHVSAKKEESCGSDNPKMMKNGWKLAKILLFMFCTTMKTESRRDGALDGGGCRGKVSRHAPAEREEPCGSNDATIMRNR